MGRLDTELLGLQIVARENAAIVGEVDGLIVDDASLKVAGFLVDLGLYEARVLPFEAALAIGEDAVVVDRAGAVRPITSEPRLENLARKEITISFARAITKSGRFIGTVGDFLIDTGTGDILGIEVIPALEGDECIPEPMFVAVDGVHKLGREVVVFTEDVEQHSLSGPTTEAVPTGPVGQRPEEASAPAVPPPPAETEDQLDDTLTDVPAPDLEEPTEGEETLTMEATPVEAVIGEPSATPVDAPAASVATDTVPATSEIEAEPAQEVEASPAQAAAEAPQSTDAAAQPRHFLLGKRVVRRIEDPDGGLIAEAGDMVSYEMIQHAKANDQLLILSLNVE